MGREKMVLYSEIAGAVTDCVLNSILIPQMASAGAALGTLAAEFVVFVIQYFALRNRIRDSFREIQYGKLLLAVFLGSFASVWVLKFNLGSFLTLLVSACLFFGMYFICLLITREPFVLEIFKKIFKRIID